MCPGKINKLFKTTLLYLSTSKYFDIKVKAAVVGRGVRAVQANAALSYGSIYDSTKTSRQV
jgi:hypothetical protein